MSVAAWVFAVFLGATAGYRIGRRIGAEHVSAVIESKAATLSLANRVNVIDGVVLPEPDDPRWECSQESPPEWARSKDTSPAVTYRLGDIRLWQISGKESAAILIGTEWAWSYLNFSSVSPVIKWNYFVAIDKAWMSRRSLHEIEVA